MLYNVTTMKQRLLSLQQWPIIMAFAQAASDRTSSAQQLPLTPSFHKFHDAAFELLPSRSGSDAILNRLQQLANAYPTYVTLTTTQKLFGLDDGQQQHSYAVIIQDKQATQDIQDHKRTDVSSFAQLELVESTSNNIKDVVDWFHHSIQNDDASASDGAASTKEEEEEAVPSTTTTHADIILNAATIGSDEAIGLAEVMLQAANCESVKDSHDGGNSNANNFLSDRRLQCRNNLKDAGVGSKDVEWLANVVFTRRTIILPSAPTHGGAAPHHGSLSLLWLVVACVGLFLTVAFMTVLTLKRKHRGRVWLEEEAKRRVTEVDYGNDFIQKDFTSELTSFDEELTVQLIEPSHNVILV